MDLEPELYNNNNLVKIYLGCNKNTYFDITNEDYIIIYEKLISKNYSYSKYNNKIYNYNNVYYNLNDNTSYKINTSKLILEDNKLIKVCNKVKINSIEFESKKNYNTIINDDLNFRINENLNIYLNEKKKSIFIEIKLNAYYKDNIELLKSLINI